MKRILALVLAVTLLLSLFVAPVAADGGDINIEPAPTVHLTAVSYTTVANYVSGGNTVTSVKPGDKLALKLSVTNNAEEVMNWAGGQFFIKYDQSAFEPDSFAYEDALTGLETMVGPIAMALPRENGGFAYVGWAGSENTDVPGLIKITKTCGEGQKEIKQNDSITIAYILFKVKDKAENGNQNFEFDTMQPNAVSAAKVKDTAPSNVAGIDFSKIHTDDVNVVDGVAPTIKSVAIDPYTATYGQAGEYELKVLSTKDKDITSLVGWTVSPADKGVSVANGKLNVTAAAPADTYTVTASGRAGESQGTAFADFTIAPKTVTNPTLTVVGFGKGAAVGDVKYSANDLNAVLSWYKGEGDPNTLTPVSAADKFKADTTYTLVLTLTPANDNYVLDPDTTVTVKNFGEERTVALKSGVAVIAAKTADNDVPTITLNPIDATYGDKLFNYNPTGTAMFGDQTVAGTFAWSTEYDANTTVRDAGEQTFNVVFTPTNTDLYATVTGKVTVTVAQKEVDITGNLNTWSANEFTYDGKSHSVELKIDEDLVGIVKVKEYTGWTEAQAVGEYTATASLELVDPANYKFKEGNDLTREHTWKINKGDLTPTANPVKSVRYGIKTVTVYPSDLGLPSGLTVTAKPDNALVTAAAANADGSVTLTLRDTTVADADVTTGKVTLIYSSDNYNPATVELTVKIIDKTENRETFLLPSPTAILFPPVSASPSRQVQATLRSSSSTRTTIRFLTSRSPLVSTK